ncbi:MAG: PIN domain-containing protein [Chloroflexota bacterium]|nr:PIN domain-containing protein [Chloroflexota bacterium]MDE3103096.1 PIN domain-containing protein [Chloroflexota bacterium]
MAGATYDTGALVAAERNDRRMWALHAELIAQRVVPTVPACVLAEAWRGGARQARLAQLLSHCVVEPLSEEQARAVGILIGRSGHDDVIDVAVAEGAIRRGDGVVTADDEIERVATAVGAALRIVVL